MLNLKLLWNCIIIAVVATSPVVAAPFTIDTLLQAATENPTPPKDEEKSRPEFEACKNKVEGDHCHLASKRGRSVNGICQKNRSNKMECMSERLSKRFGACKGKQSGERCHFNGRTGRIIKGNCRVNAYKKMVCVSDVAQRAQAACEDKKVGDSCYFKGNRNNTILGTCIQRLDGEHTCSPTKFK